jgi:hypothetical protein
MVAAGPNHDLTEGCLLGLEEVWACKSLLSRPGDAGTQSLNIMNSAKAAKYSLTICLASFGKK